MERRRLVVGGALVAAVASAAAWLLHPTVEVNVATAALTSGTIVRRIVATGTLQAVRTVDIGSQESGNIQSIEVDFNSIVHSGQVVARLDPALYEAQLSEARAALGKTRADQVSAETALRDAEIKLTRAEALAARALIPAADLDSARIAAATVRADLAAAKSNVVDAEAQVKQAQLDVDRTVITSPIDGIVVARDVDVGQTLAASVQSPTLFSIATDLRRMQVQVAIDESDVDGIAAGEPVTFQVGSYPNESFHGTVQEVRLQPVTNSGSTSTASAASPLSLLAAPVAPTTVAASNSGPSGTTVSYTTIVDVANADERLRPGMTATVVLDGSRREHAVRIPNVALMFRPSDDVLAALHESDSAVTQDLAGDDAGRARLVWRQDGEKLAPVWVRTGLSDGSWTELIGGGLPADVPLVTSAKVERCARILTF